MKAKKLTTFLLAAAMTATATGSITAQAADNITVTVDGQKVIFDQPPVNINGRVMVPIRAVAEKMGWEVEWFTYYGNRVVNGRFQQEHDVILRKRVGNTVGYVAGYQTNFHIEGQTKMSDITYEGQPTPVEKPVIAPLIVLNGRTLFGIRDIAECMYADVQWDGATKTVRVTTKDVKSFPHYQDVLDYIKMREQRTSEIAESEEKAKKEAEEKAKEESVDSSEYAAEVVRLVNEERVKRGIAPLEVDATLMEAAEIRAKELPSNYSHTRPDGTIFSTVLTELGWKNSYVGENAYEGRLTPNSAMDGWMKSKGHRENILRENYNYIGVGCFYDEDKDYSYWIQIFSS